MSVKKVFEAVGIALGNAPADTIANLDVDVAILKPQVPVPGGISPYSLLFTTLVATVLITKMTWANQDTNDGQHTFFRSSTGATPSQLNEIFGPNTDGLDAPHLLTAQGPRLIIEYSKSDAGDVPLEVQLKVMNMLAVRAQEQIEAALRFRVPEGIGSEQLRKLLAGDDPRRGGAR